MPRKPNFMIVITDQQSANPYWPERWEEQNLPAMRWLREHGLSFDRAYTNSCTCSPARVTMLTGLYPAQHGVTEVLEFDNIATVATDVASGGNLAQTLTLNMKERRQRVMPSNVQNLAKILKTAGYNVIYKGKWHLTKPASWVGGLAQKYWTSGGREAARRALRVRRLGHARRRRQPGIANMGAGTTKNDQRFIDGRGQAAKYGDVPYESSSSTASSTSCARTTRTSRSASSSPWSTPTTCSPTRARAAWRSTASRSIRPGVTATRSSRTCRSTGRRPGTRTCRRSRARRPSSSR